MLSLTDVADRLEQAAHTLRRLPKVGIDGYRSYWPPMVNEFHEAYGYNAAEARLGPPTARHITEMDQALRWLLWLTTYESKLVWLRANEVRWKLIQRKLGYSRSKLQCDWKAALLAIHQQLQNSYGHKELFMSALGLLSPKV